MTSWPSVLKTGFGNVFDVVGWWGQEGITLIATAINSGRESDWKIVTMYAIEVVQWDIETMN